jgi:hypothetical protein
MLIDIHQEFVLIGRNEAADQFRFKVKDSDPELTDVLPVQSIIDWIENVGKSPKDFFVETGNLMQPVLITELYGFGMLCTEDGSEAIFSLPVNV